LKIKDFCLLRRGSSREFSKNRAWRWGFLFAFGEEESF